MVGKPEVGQKRASGRSSIDLLEVSGFGLNSAALRAWKGQVFDVVASSEFGASARKATHSWHGLEWIPWRAARTDLDIWGRVSHFDSGAGGHLT